MVLIHIVKINTLNVKLNLYYLIITYTNKTLGKIPAVLVSAGNRGEEPPRIIVPPRRVTAMAIAEKKDYPKYESTLKLRSLMK